MSKSEQVRAENAEKKRLKKEREAFEAKKAKVRKVTAIVTTSIIGALMLVFFVGIIVNNVRVNNGSYLRGKIAASSHDHDVDGMMMTYYYNDVYNSFVDYYGSYVYYYGLDTTVSTKVQQISEGETWFEYFMTGAQDNVTALLALVEAADDEGFTVSDADYAALSDRVKTLEPALWGRGVKNADILAAKELELLAYRYQFAKQREFTPSESEINAQYKADPQKYQAVDYYAYTLNWANGTLTEEDARTTADRLANQKSESAFKSVLRELLAKDYPSYTDEELDEELELRFTEGALYTKDNEFAEWAFGGAKVGETTTVEDTGNSQITVYMLASEPERTEDKTVDVRHILFATETYGSIEAAYKQAEKVLAELGNAPSDETFATAALKWSDDVGTYYNGGLCESVVEGTMLTGFNDWCFNPSRESGELAIIETDIGCHIVYFIGEGLSVWQASASDDIISERFNELNSELLEKHTTQFDLTVLDEIPG